MSNGDPQPEATILFADISGFTAVSEKLDPEAVTDLMNDCFARLEAVVLVHGGRVDKFLGDCIVAAFGLAGGSPDAGAAGAVGAAIEIRSAVRELARSVPAASGLDVHVGIATGAVVAGEVGGSATRTFTVRGEAVDRAATLEDVSEPGEILVSGRTQALLGPEFEHRGGRPDVAGMTVHEVLGLSRSQRRVRRPSERREASILFVDLIGFEAASAGLAGDDARLLLNRCFEELERAVTEFGGVVDKYIGQGMMALFGVPRAIERAPHQALNAAIDMRRRLAQLRGAEQLGTGIDLHVGVNTGLVIAGDIGGRAKRDFTVMGDAVNLAARLKAAAPTGEIYVGPDTRRAALEDFEFRPLPPLRLKGKAEPVHAHLLQSTEPHVHRTRASSADRRISSRMVGRQRELATLEACLDQLQGGSGRLVAVVGDAGLGKSRLLAEVYAAAEHRKLTVLEARSLALGTNLRFHPFVDGLRRWAGLAEGQTDAAATRKLGAAMEAVMGAEAAATVPLVATLMALPLLEADDARLTDVESDALEQMIENAIRDLLRAIARRRPTLLVFEDVHWADQSSIQLLENLAHLVTEAPIVLIGAARPDHETTSGRLFDAARRELGDAFVEMRLGPLDSKEADVLVRNLLQLDDLPHRLRTLIGRRAEGNPFYVEEILQSLIDAGAIERVQDRFRVTPKIEGVVVPATIQEVTLGRVHGLPADARDLIEIAAVIGRRFARELLARVERDEGDLEQSLQTLVDRQLLAEQLTESGTHYFFKHALLQEAVYETLLMRRRRELHDRVASSMEALYAERIADVAPMLAFHYLRAENLDKAEIHLFQAGEDAARAAASSEALHFFEEALRVYLALHGAGGDPRRKALLERNIGMALLGKGALPDSVEHFDRALEFLGEPVSHGVVGAGGRFAVDLLMLLARLYANRIRGRLRDVDREAFEVRYSRARAQTTSDPRRFVFDTIGSLRRITETDPEAIDQACAIYTSGAAVFAWLGLSFAVCKRFLSVARTLVRQGNLRDEFGYASWKFIVHFLEGDWSEEHVIPDHLVDEALRAGQFWDVNTYLGLDCERRIHRGDLAGARAQLERITHLADVVGYDFAWTNVHAMSTFLAIEEGRFDAAHESAALYYGARAEASLNVLALGLRAAIHAGQGDWAAAAATVEEGEALMKRVRDVPGFHRSLLVRGRLVLDLRALEEHRRSTGGWSAVRSVRAARRSARPLRAIARAVARERVPSRRLQGRLEWLAGHYSRAVRWWEDAIETGERMGAKPEVARTYVEAGSRLLGAGHDGRRVKGLSPAECVAHGRAMLQELGVAAEYDLPGARSLDASGEARVA